MSITAQPVNAEAKAHRWFESNSVSYVVDVIKNIGALTMPNSLSRAERDELRRIYNKIAETMPIAPELTIPRLLDTIDELEAMYDAALDELNFDWS